MRNDEILRELRGRAERRFGERRLLVDYYRIRRRVSYPWPLANMPVVGIGAGMTGYPWEVWFSWELEERVNAMGWWAEIGGDDGVRGRVREEVLGMARWPGHFVGAGSAMPGLGMSHLLRTLILARRHWGWLGAEAGREVQAACARALAQKQDWIAETAGKWQDVAELRKLGVYERSQVTKNIPLISALVMAMAAVEAGREGDAYVGILRRHAEAMLETWLEMIELGTSEGIAYDGYVVDFLGDYLKTAGVTEERATAAAQRPAVRGQLEMVAELAAPGDVINVAAIGDVEPREMTFYASGAVKMARIAGMDAASGWFLARCRLDWLRAECLGLMHGMKEPFAAAPAAGARAGRYTASLRSGYGDEDVAVVMSAGKSVMHHLHRDAGSIVIGHRGVWLIGDPGYQQYLETREREFTLGKTAHNGPVINGVMQDRVGAKVLAAEQAGKGRWRMGVDMTGCYPAAAKVAKAVRWVWLLDGWAIVVCDVLEGAVERAGYTWHGSAEAGWWAEGGRAVIGYEGAELWVGSPSVEIEQGMIDRLRGSRGAMSLSAEVKGDGGRVVCWWGFGVGRAVGFEGSAGAMRVEGAELRRGEGNW